MNCACGQRACSSCCGEDLCIDCAIEHECGIATDIAHRKHSENYRHRHYARRYLSPLKYHLLKSRAENAAINYVNFILRPAFSVLDTDANAIVPAPVMVVTASQTWSDINTAQSIELAVLWGSCADVSVLLMNLDLHNQLTSKYIEIKPSHYTIIVIIKGWHTMIIHRTYTPSNAEQCSQIKGRQMRIIRDGNDSTNNNLTINDPKNNEIVI